MVKFPFGKHDDMVDALSGAVSLLKTKWNKRKAKSFRMDMGDLLK